MSDRYARIDKAKQLLKNKKDTEGISSLPPGYKSGLTIKYNTEDSGVNTQLRVTPGIINIAGRRVEIKSDHPLSGTEYDIPNINTDDTFYVYLDGDSKFHIDVSPPIFSNAYYAYYHKAFSQYRYIGKFFKYGIHPSDNYVEVFSGDPLETPSVS